MKRCRYVSHLAQLGTILQDFQGLQAADLRAVGVHDPDAQAAILTRLRLPPPLYPSPSTGAAGANDLDLER